MQQQQAQTSGLLRLHVIEAKLTRDTEWFSKMDPWVQIHTRQQKVRTKTLQGAGKTPKWDQVFDIDVKYIGDDMQVHVYDEDLTCSETIGSTVIKISALCVNGGIDDWFPIHWKGKQSGSLRLKGVWTPAGQGVAQSLGQNVYTMANQAVYGNQMMPQ